MSTEYADFLQSLAQLLPDESVYLDNEDIKPFECDGLSAYRDMPLAVVLPRSVEQVRTVVRHCHEHGVIIVPRGAGTGLSGGATPNPNGILLGLNRLNRIKSIDPTTGSAVVEPGVRNLAISEAAKPYGLHYAPDPSSQIACSIGGNVAENAGGVHCLKYGLTVNNVLAVTIVTAEGELMELGSVTGDAAGLDLLAVIHGSEGLLGIVVEITVRLLPLPDTTKTLLAAFDKAEDAGNAVASIIAEGIIPAGLEMMDNGAIRAAEDFIHAGYPVDADALLICEVDGLPAEAESQLEQVKGVLNQFNPQFIQVAQDEQQRMTFWAGRKSAFPAVGRLTPDYYCMDGTIPRKHLAAILKRINELSEEYQQSVVNVFHAGDGNLHPLIMYDAGNEGELERTEALGGKILEACVDFGGTITGEHGVGLEKIGQMCHQFNTKELTQFHALKKAWDEKTLLNPTKAIPTLQRCAEFGAMHVHHGELPHPELERF